MELSRVVLLLLGCRTKLLQHDNLHALYTVNQIVQFWINSILQLLDYVLVVSVGLHSTDEVPEVL
jgi:hypothetical protein